MSKLGTALKILKRDGLWTLARYALTKAGVVKSVRVGGWVVPSNPRAVAYHLMSWERGVKEAVALYTPRTFVTAGAYPMDYVRLAWDLGTPLILAFEPHPNNWGYCRDFLESNRRKFRKIVERGGVVTASRGNQTLILINKALWHKRAKLRMTKCGSTESTMCIDENGAVEVEATALNEHADVIKPPCLIHLDIEGAETNALAGAYMLWNVCDFIIEVQRKNKKRVINFLTEFGFEWLPIERVPENNVEYWFVSKNMIPLQISMLAQNNHHPP